MPVDQLTVSDTTSTYNERWGAMLMSVDGSFQSGAQKNAKSLLPSFSVPLAGMPPPLRELLCFMIHHELTHTALKKSSVALLLEYILVLSLFLYEINVSRGLLGAGCCAGSCEYKDK